MWTMYGHIRDMLDMYLLYNTQSTGQCLQRPLIAFDAWLLALGR